VTEVRTAAVGDAAAIAGVHRLSRAHYYGTEPDPGDDRAAMWAALLDRPDHTTWVAELDDTVVAFLSAARDSVQMKLTALYVLPDRIGTGLGSVLHDRFVADRPAGVEGVLEVWAGNDRAIGFYQRRGWLPTATTRPGPQGRAFVTWRLPAG
jgi:GNAT superfamily N-acetyltransferase